MTKVEPRVLVTTPDLLAALEELDDAEKARNLMRFVDAAEAVVRDYRASKEAAHGD